MSSKLREALEEIHCQIINRLNGNLSETKMLLDVKNIINKALAEPLRNCDIGSAEEQYQRWDKYCNSFGIQCDKCGLNSNIHSDLTAKCFACWAQMPYESEVK